MIGIAISKGTSSWCSGRSWALPSPPVPVPCPLPRSPAYPKEAPRSKTALVAAVRRGAPWNLPKVGGRGTGIAAYGIP